MTYSIVFIDAVDHQEYWADFASGKGLEDFRASAASANLDEVLGLLDDGWSEDVPAIRSQVSKLAGHSDPNVAHSANVVLQALEEALVTTSLDELVAALTNGIGEDDTELTEAKDGDGDGLVFDGSPNERPATEAEKSAGKKRTGKKTAKSSDQPASPIAELGAEVAAKFKHKGPYKADGEFVRKRNLNLDQAQDAINARAADFVSKLREGGANVGGGKVTALNTGTPNPRHEAEVGKATAFLESVVGPNVNADLKWQMGPGMREEYSPATGTIKMTGMQPLHSAFIHEAAHHIERTNPKVAADVKAFLEQRTKQFKSKQVKMQSFNRGYSPQETGNDAGFSKAMGSPERGAYTGMVYPDGATEVLSMGLQRLHSNPAKFFKDDPEYAGFVIKVLNQ
jgi:hypothetical protein